MEQKSGTGAWNRARTEILCLEQLHGTEVLNNGDHDVNILYKYVT